MLQTTNIEDAVFNDDLDVDEYTDSRENLEEDDDQQDDDQQADQQERLFHDNCCDESSTTAVNEGEDTHPTTFLWEQLHVPMMPNISTTVAEGILLLMSFVLHYDLPWVAMEDLFVLMNVIFGFSVFPQTKHMLAKLFGGMNSAITFHVFCPACQNYLRKYTGQIDKSVNAQCSQCTLWYNVRKLTADGHCFVTLSVKDQLNALLKNESIASLLKERLDGIDKIVNPASVKDITDGHLYKMKRRDLALKKHDITATFNTDGSPVFNSSKSSIWPIQLVVNELPPKLRWQHVIVAGLWYGPSHPNMQMFLQAFVQEFEPLSSNGFQWVYQGITYCSRMFAICACVDWPARALLQNTVQYNGYFGCSWCLHPGVLIDGE